MNRLFFSAISVLALSAPSFAATKSEPPQKVEGLAAVAVVSMIDEMQRVAGDKINAMHVVPRAIDGIPGYAHYSDSYFEVECEEPLAEDQLTSCVFKAVTKKP